MAENKTLYKQILKATTIFGGVQVFNIVISIIRTKVIAVLIGPAGMGIAGLFNVAINLISGVSSLGLETSAVKYISQSNVSEDKSGLSKIIAVLRKTVWFTGIIGALLMIVFSKWLSQITFENTDYYFCFLWLSLTLLFKQLTIGQFAVLQGLQKLKLLARANLMGSLFGLLASIPLYFYYKIDAIVPAIILSSLAGLLFSWFYSRSVKIETVKIPVRQLIAEGKGMLELGILISLAGLITTFVAYIIQIYITRKSGIVETGLYNAGFTLLNSYVGLIFAAMGTDFFPRLAAVSDDNEKVRTTVLHQAQIAVLIITPIIVMFLAFAPLLISILYSEKFLAIIPMVSFGITGMLFRAVSWSMGYILLAKGDSNMFIKTSFGFNALFLLLHIGGFYFYGMTGLGMAFTIHYFLHFIILNMLTRSKYNFYFPSNFYKLLIISLLLCVVTFFLTFIKQFVFRCLTMAILVLISSLYSLYQLDQKMNLWEMFRNKFNFK